MGWVNFCAWVTTALAVQQNRLSLVVVTDGRLMPAESRHGRPGSLSAWHLLSPRARRAKQARWPSSVAPADASETGQVDTFHRRNTCEVGVASKAAVCSSSSGTSFFGQRGKGDTSSSSTIGGGGCRTPSFQATFCEGQTVTKLLSAKVRP